MELTYSELSTTGPVRQNNEDKPGFWKPEGNEERLNLGALAIMADGVGGLGHGEVASGLAVEAALSKFKEITVRTDAKAALWQVLNAANLAVYDASMKNRDNGRMATTFTASMLRNNEVTIGHVGDCRVYLIQNGQIRKLTTDHTYAALQVKLGLISEHDAMSSEMRCVLTRNLGHNPVVQVDFYSVLVHAGDRLVQCTDGMHSCVTETEILEIAAKQPPDEACRSLVALAERRGTEDNVSVQVIQIEQVEQVMFYRGLPMYQKESNLSMSNEIQPGQVLDGRFQINDTICRGGMAAVFKATDIKTNQIVAIKAPFMRYESDPAFFSRFKQEEEIGVALNHPYILNIMRVEEKSRPYMVMEYLEGQTLDQLLNVIKPLPVQDALKFASRICEALDYMHKQKVVHRDLKPQNIMVCNDGTIRVMDFGIAKAAGKRRITFVGFSPAMGTPDYMAPEQVKGKRGDERTDIYSLGAMLYEMVTGATPFEGANAYVVMNSRLSGDPVAPRKLNKEISPEVEEIILHSMERNPVERYPDAASMKAELDAPETVKLTGRNERLQAPNLTLSSGRQWVHILLYVLIPIFVFGMLFLLTRHH